VEQVNRHAWKKRGHGEEPSNMKICVCTRKLHNFHELVAMLLNHYGSPLRDP
jgi:hypothetical protein